MKRVDIKILRERGWLQIGDGKHAQTQKRLPEGRIRIYTLVGQRIFDDIEVNKDENYKPFLLPKIKKSLKK